MQEHLHYTRDFSVLADKKPLKQAYGANCGLRLAQTAEIQSLVPYVPNRLLKDG